MHPLFREFGRDLRHNEDKDRKQPACRRGDPESVLPGRKECHIVDEQHDRPVSIAQERLVSRRHDLHFAHDLKCTDRTHGEQIIGRRADRGERDAEEDRSASGAVQFRRLVHRSVHIGQRRLEQNDAEPDVPPRLHEHRRPDDEIGIGDPLDVGNAECGEHRVEDAEIGLIHHLEHERAGDDGTHIRNKEHRAEKLFGNDLPVEQIGNAQTERHGDGNIQPEDNGVEESTVKHGRVLPPEKSGIVVKSAEHPVRKNRGIQLHKAHAESEHHGDQHEQQKTDQRQTGKQKVDKGIERLCRVSSFLHGLCSRHHLGSLRYFSWFMFHIVKQIAALSIVFLLCNIDFFGNQGLFMLFYQKRHAFVTSRTHFPAAVFTTFASPFIEKAGRRPRPAGNVRKIVFTKKATQMRNSHRE